MIRKFLNKNEIIRNTFVLVQGTAAAQIITILMQPVLRRIFTTEDFGLMALYLSTIGILSVVACGRYEMAVMLPKEDKDANGIFKIALSISFVFNLILFAVILFTGEYIIEKVEDYELINPESSINLSMIRLSLYLVPVGVFLISVYNALNFLLTRKKEYKKLSGSRVLQTGATNGVQVGFGAINYGVGGLIYGQLIGQSAAVIYMFLVKRKIISGEGSDLKNKLKEYRDFPLKGVPSSLINMLALQLPNYFIVGFFGLGIGGIYDVINKVLNLPLTMIGKSISQVFYQKVSEDIAKGKNISKYIRKFTFRLLLLMFLPMAVIFFFGEPLFAFVFGEEYSLAGTLAGYFAAYYLVRFVYFSQSTLLSAKRKIGLELMQNSLFLATQVAALLFGYYYFKDFEITFVLLALSGFVCYTIFIIQLLITASKT